MITDTVNRVMFNKQEVGFGSRKDTALRLAQRFGAV